MNGITLIESEFEDVDLISLDEESDQSDSDITEVWHRVKQLKNENVCDGSFGSRWVHQKRGHNVKN